MSELYISIADRKRIVTKWVERTLFILHTWAFMCIGIISRSSNDAAINALASVFSTCTFGIGLTLGVLILDRGADFLMDKFAGLPKQGGMVTETTSKTTEVKPAEAIHADNIT